MLIVWGLGEYFQVQIWLALKYRYKQKNGLPDYLPEVSLKI